MIKFVKLNEVHSKIFCSSDLLHELIDEYAKFAPNYKHNPLFKARKWDGKIRFVSTKGIFYTGLLKHMWLSCKERGYSDFSFEGYDTTAYYTDDDVITRLEQFKMPFEFWEEQVLAITESLTRKRRLLVSPTSSGKSAIIYAVSRILMEDGLRVLIQVPSVMLVNQLVADFESYAKDDTFDVEANVHKIYSGEEKFTDKPIVISTWQSIDAMEIKEKKKVIDDERQRDFMESFDVVISDEVHKCEAKVVKSIMEKAINAFYRLGFTGTLKEDSKSLPENLIGLYGKPVVVTTTKELMEQGKVAKLKIYSLVLNYPDEMRKLVAKMDYQQELDTITGFEKRNMFIANLAKKLDGNTIVLLRYIDKHAKPLKELLEKHTNKKVIILDKDTKVNTREDIRKSLENIDDAIIIGTYALISTGISIKNLKYLIFASPLKSRTSILQAIGRILRLHNNKELAIAFDLVDNLEWKGKNNFLLDHFVTRFEYYSSEQHDVEIKEFNFE